MIINEVTLNNFLHFKNKKVIIGSDNVLIFGSNGSGKSALLDAISFALYGRCMRYIQLSKADVVLDFTIDNNRYTINRSIDDGKQTIRFLKDNTEMKVERIAKILGSFDEFLLRCIIRQDYLKIVDYDIIDALKETFNLSNYDEYNAKIVTKLNDKNLLLKELESDKDRIISEIEEYKILDKRSIEKEIKEIEKRKRKEEIALEKIKKRLALLEKKDSKLKTNSISGLKAKIAVLNEELKNKELLLKRLGISKEEYNAIKKEYNEFIRLKSKIAGLDKKRVKYETLTNMISLLQSILEQKSKVSVQLSNDLKNIKQRYKNSNLELKKLRDEMIKLDKSKIELESKRYRLDAEINLAKEELATVLERTKITRKSKRCPICKQQIPNVKDLIAHMNDEANKIRKEIKDKDQELSDVMVKLRQVDTKIHQVEVMIAKAEATTKSMVEDLEKRAIDIKNEIENLNNKLSRYKKELSTLRFDPKSYDKDKTKYEQLSKANIIEKYTTITSKFDKWQMLNQDISKIKNVISILTKKLKVDDTVYNDIINTRIEIVKLDNKIKEYDILLAKKKEELEDILMKSKKNKELKTRLNSLNSSINDINAEIEALNKLRSILRDTLLDLITKIIDNLQTYIKDLKVEFKDNKLFVNSKEFTNLSRGEKSLFYLILRVAYMQAVDSPLIIMDDNLSLMDRDKVKLLLSNIDAPLIALSHNDFGEFFNKMVEL